MSILDPRIRWIGPGDYEAVKKAAEADGHPLILPTHVVWKREQPVGYLSINAAPLVSVWLNSKEVSSRDSAAVATFFENVVADKAPFVVVSCNETSPFYPFMKEIGYTDGGKINLFYKQLSKG